jgi:pyruvate kinase
MESEPRALIRELGSIHRAIVETDDVCAPYLSEISDEQRASARNLLHYLALRRHDVRSAQARLASHGLSSLGRTESHVRSGLEAVLRVLHLLDGTEYEARTDPAALTVDAGAALLTAHTDALLGPPPKGRVVRIMVTMPSEAGTDYPLVRDLVNAGMDCMRINCAHDDPDVWARMVDNLGRARRELKRSCRLSMDIAGPKVRTGPLEPGPTVLKIKPRRNAVGDVIAPAMVALTQAGRGASLRLPVDAVLQFDGEVSPIEIGDRIEFQDLRGRSRHLLVQARDGALIVAALEHTAYIGPQTILRFPAGTVGPITRSVANVPHLEQTLTLKKGDTLRLTSDAEPGRAALCDERGRVLLPARIGVTLPEVFSDVRAGEAVWLDDGKIGGVVRGVERGEIIIEITQAPTKGAKLGAAKGINLPDTKLQVAALTPADLEALKFVSRHADLIGYSFVHNAEDIHELQDRLADLHATHVGMVLKVETRHAFDELPKLLLACMRAGRFGVMIARGDLAVECGFERMAEVQEEILWICEAAHTPVIWATQVLESVAKTGMPSRAEVTDAAMSERAECVMLNKGPHVREAVAMLDDILRRMQAHQTKKRTLLRPLQIADTILSELAARRPRQG